METEYTEEPTGQKVDKFLNLEGGAKTPLAISVVSGVLALVLSLFALDIVKDFWTDLPGYELRISGIISVLVASIVWWGEIGGRRRVIKNSFIQLVEVVTDSEIDGDSIGESPQKKVGKMYVVTLGNETHRVWINWYERDFHEVFEVAVRTLRNIPFSEGEYIKGNGYLFSKEKYSYLKPQLFAQGLIENVDSRPNSATRWTKWGSAWARTVTGRESTHSPTDFVEGEYTVL